MDFFSQPGEFDTYSVLNGTIIDQTDYNFYLDLVMFDQSPFKIWNFSHPIVLSCMEFSFSYAENFNNMHTN
jgi:hypothetical protein